MSLTCIDFAPAQAWLSRCMLDASSASALAAAKRRTAASVSRLIIVRDGSRGGQAGSPALHINRLSLPHAAMLPRTATVVAVVRGVCVGVGGRGAHRLAAGRAAGHAA